MYQQRVAHLTTQVREKSSEIRSLEQIEAEKLKALEATRKAEQEKLQRYETLVTKAKET